MLSLRSTCLISTLATLMPQASVCWSRISWMSAVELVALGQHLVELVLAEHRAQRGLRQLAGRGHEVLDLDDRALGIDDAEIEHRIDLHRDVVARDHVLRRHVLHDHAQIDPHHLLHEGDEDDQARPLDPGEAPEREDDAALVFPQDANRRGQEHDHDERQDQIGDVTDDHRRSPSLASRSAARTVSVEALDALTSTCSPGAKASSASRPPALALREHMALACRPVEDLGRQSAHRLPADTGRRCARCPEIAAGNEREAERHCGGGADDGPRQPEAGRLDLEQHGSPEQKGHHAAEAEHNRRVEDFDDEEDDAEQHQARPA